MDMLILGFAVMTFFSTLIGGTVAIKFRKILPYFFAFAAGSLLAVTFFDILPESIQVSQSISVPVRYVMIVLVGTFLFYTLLEKYFHHHHEHGDHPHIMGPVGAGGLTIHSFLDGVAIGAAYQLNPSIGLIVALAVIFHDFTDGINTVTLMLKNKHNVKRTSMFLLADAIAPVLGVASTFLVSINQTILALILAAFAGEFLYIGATNLTPKIHKHTSWKMVLSMGLAVLLIFTLTSII